MFNTLKKSKKFTSKFLIFFLFLGIFKILLEYSKKFSLEYFEGKFIVESILVISLFSKIFLIVNFCKIFNFFLLNMIIYLLIIKVFIESLFDADFKELYIN